MQEEASMSENWIVDEVLAAVPEKEERAVVTRPLQNDEIEVCEAILVGESPRVAFRRITGKHAEDSLRRFLGNIEVQCYLAARRAEVQAKKRANEDPAEEWLRQTEAAAYFDPIEVALTGISGPGDLAQLPADVRQQIAGWKWDKAGNFVIDWVDKKASRDMLAKYWGLYQAERINDRDAPQALLRTVFWRYVMALHLHEGMSIMEAQVHARKDPDAVQEWGREQKLLPSGEAAGEIVVPPPIAPGPPVGEDL